MFMKPNFDRIVLLRFLSNFEIFDPIQCNCISKLIIWGNVTIDVRVSPLTPKHKEMFIIRLFDTIRIS
jgi:hypothetical protein